MDRRKLVIFALLVIAILSGKSPHGSTTPSPAAEVIRTDEGPAYLGLQYTGEPVARVVGIAPGYPAWRAGIRCGDQVLFLEAGGARFPLADASKYADPGTPLKLVTTRQVDGVWHVEEHFVQPSTRPAREPGMVDCRVGSNR